MLFRSYPVALDNTLSTWTNYRNRYWPAHYLIDAEGTVRHISFGEGNYEATEKMIRELLVDADPDVRLPAESGVEDETPELGSTTPETFLGSSKDVNYGGGDEYGAGESEFSFPADQAEDTFALDGTWEIATQYATPAASGAEVRLSYRASEVRMVLAGSGEITVTTDNGEIRMIDVSGAPRSYRLLQGDAGSGELTVKIPEGIQAYSFTFG